MYATYEYTTYQNVIAQTKKKLSLENTTSEDFFLRQLLIEGIGEIPSLSLTESKSETIEICDFKAKLPCGFIRFHQPNGIRFRDGDNVCWYPRTVNNVIFQNNGEFPCRDNIQLNAGYIYFSNTTQATKVDIYGLFVLVDDQGRPKVPISHSRVLQYYIMGMYAQTNINKYPLWSEWMDKFGRGKRMLKGKSNVPDVNDKEEIYKIMNTLL